MAAPSVEFAAGTVAADIGLFVVGNGQKIAGNAEASDDDIGWDDDVASVSVGGDDAADNDEDEAAGRFSPVLADAFERPSRGLLSFLPPPEDVLSSLLSPEDVLLELSGEARCVSQPY